jgi:hypothetical protein
VAIVCVIPDFGDINSCIMKRQSLSKIIMSWVFGRWILDGSKF